MKGYGDELGPLHEITFSRRIFRSLSWPTRRTRLWKRSSCEDADDTAARLRAAGATDVRVRHLAAPHG